MKIKAVILAGGVGTRLQPITFSIPKPLIPVGERPILENILFHLRSYDIREFIFSVGYRAELIETYFGDGSKYDVKIRYYKEDKPLGTAGSLPCIQNKFPFKKGESFLLMNGDILTNLNVAKFWEYHQKKRPLITVGVKKFAQQLPFGVLKIGKESVLGITEKPTRKFNVSAGIYIISQSVLKEIPQKQFFTLPELIGKLILKKKNVGAYMIDKYWRAIESLKDVEEALNDIEQWENGKQASYSQL